jgi:hypothetical protein
MHNVQHASTQISECKQLLQQLISQTHQASQQYEIMLHQEQQNAQQLQQLAQREQQAAQMIQGALQGHHLAIQRMQQAINVVAEMDREIRQGQSFIGFDGGQTSQGYGVSNGSSYHPGQPVASVYGGFRS